MIRLRSILNLGPLACLLATASGHGGDGDSDSVINSSDPYPILQHNYNASNFFDEFSFFSDPDPTQGFVEYQTLEAANSSGIAGIKDGAVYLGSDATTNPPRSTRVQSIYNKYNLGLFVADVARMPDSECGVWPAFWTVTSDNTWPVGGEIDIIEGVNDMAGNAPYLHTGPGCNLTNMNPAASSSNKNLGWDPKSSDDCNAGSGSMGCGFGRVSGGFGKALNQENGGVYAMEWTENDIRVWYFPRNSIPQDIKADTPNPMSWPQPQAHFGGSGCNIGQQFQNHQIVINTDFCGAYAGNDDVWKASSCGTKAKTCKEFVIGNPQAFKNAYWQINSIKVFQSPNGDPWAGASSKSKSAVVGRSSKMDIEAPTTNTISTVGTEADNAIYHDVTVINNERSLVIKRLARNIAPSETNISQAGEVLSTNSNSRIPNGRTSSTSNHNALIKPKVSEYSNDVIAPDLVEASPKTGGFAPRGSNWRVGLEKHL